MTSACEPGNDKSGMIDESGMTLIEILITVTILVIIAFPIASMLTIGLIIPSQEQQRISDTGDAQLLQSFLINDIQTAGTGLVATDGSISCSGHGVNPVLFGLQWVDQTTTSTQVTKTVDYEQSGTDLIRRYCDPSSTNSVIVLNSLNGAPTFSCTSATCAVSVNEKGTRSDEQAYTFTLTATRRDS